MQGENRNISSAKKFLTKFTLINDKINLEKPTPKAQN